MVNIFPDLLTFGLLAPFIIRLLLGAYFVIWGWNTAREKNAELGERGIAGLPKKIIGAIGLIAGLCTIVGFGTQIAATVLAALSAYFGRQSNNRLSFILLFGMALSLLFSGAGFLAFDLPL